MVGPFNMPLITFATCRAFLYTQMRRIARGGRGCNRSAEGAFSLNRFSLCWFGCVRVTVKLNTLHNNEMYNTFCTLDEQRMQSWPAGTSLPATGAEAAGSGADAGSHALLADENNGVCTALHKLPRININFYATKAAAAAGNSGGSRCSNNSRNNNGNKRRLSPASAAKYAAVFHIATTL